MGKKILNSSKDEFLKASFGYLVEHGLENTSVRDMCKKLGLSPGSLYYWLEGGKEEFYISIVKYGMSSVAQALFEFAFENIHDVRHFFDVAPQEISKYTKELRLLFQVATSPVYGDRMRASTDYLYDDYDLCIEKLSEILGCDAEKLAPLIFMYISVLMDYVVWDDYEVAKLQFDYVYERICELKDSSKKQ